MEEKAVSVSVDVTDAILTASIKADFIAVLRDLAKKSDNTIDDSLVEMISLAAKNLDWKGYAKGVL